MKSVKKLLKNLNTLKLFAKYSLLDLIIDFFDFIQVSLIIF